jgi:hypothetical protein
VDNLIICLLKNDKKITRSDSVFFVLNFFEEHYSRTAKVLPKEALVQTSIDWLLKKNPNCP